MTDLHEGILELFASAQIFAMPASIYGRREVGATFPAPKTSKTSHCTACGRRGHRATVCVNRDEWNVAPTTEGA